MATELAVGYISLVPSMKGFQQAVTSEIGKISAPAAKQGSAIGDNLLAGIGKTMKVGAIAVGTTAIAGIGAALVNGFSRLNSLDQATAKLTGLGHSAQSVDTIMGNALASVKGTAFGLDEAATSAAGAVAAGIQPGAQLERSLKLVADAATIAGTDMGSMGAIFNKVAASNKIQMDVINQLHDAGIPALSLLAQQMGVTAEEASKMASEGAIDFATFQAAMESGLGGAALASGDTFQGAMDNMMAALGRLGASALEGVFPVLQNGFAGLTTWLDSIGPDVQRMGAAFGDFAATTGKVVLDVFVGIGQAIGNVAKFIRENLTWVGPLAVAVGTAVATFLAWNLAIAAWQAIMKAATAIQLAFNAVMNANPIMRIVTLISALVAGLVYFFTQTELGQAIWENVTNAIGTAITWLWETIIQPVFNFIGAIFEWVYNNVILPIVTGIMLYIGLWAAAITWLWENVVSPVFGFIGAIFEWVWNSIISPVIGWIQNAITAAGAVFTWLYANAIQPAFDGVASAFNWVWNSIIRPIIDFINGAISTVGNTVSDVFGGIAGFVEGAFNSVLSVIRGPMNAIIDLINGAIEGLNSISVSIPDWVPVVGGQTFGVNIPTIPRLAAGGIVSARSGGILANIGEGRYDEAVVPLSPAVLEQLGGSRGDVYVQNPFTGDYLLAKTAKVADGRIEQHSRLHRVALQNGSRR